MRQRQIIEQLAPRIRSKEATTDEVVSNLKAIAEDTPNDSTLGFFIRTLINAI